MSEYWTIVYLTINKKKVARNDLKESIKNEV